MGEEIPIFIAFGAGVISFFSACVLPLIPAYISFITGLSFEEITSGQRIITKTGKIIINVLLFVLGFSLVFTILGATASILGKLIFSYRYILIKVAGVIIIIFGIHLTGLFRIGFLNFERRIDISKGRKISYVTSFLVGLGFAIGWTPCVGPILTSILLMASTTESVSQGMFLLFIYSMGLGLPFLIVGLMINKFLAYFKKIKNYHRAIEFVSGFFLIIIGLLIFFDKLNLISNYLTRVL